MNSSSMLIYVTPSGIFPITAKEIREAGVRLRKRGGIVQDKRGKLLSAMIEEVTTRAYFAGEPVDLGRDYIRSVA